MALTKLYDDEQVAALAEDLKENVMLHGYAHQMDEQYNRLARKLYLSGWRKEVNRDEADSGA